MIKKAKSLHRLKAPIIFFICFYTSHQEITMCKDSNKTTHTYKDGTPLSQKKPRVSKHKTKFPNGVYDFPNIDKQSTFSPSSAT